MSDHETPNWKQKAYKRAVGVLLVNLRTTFDSSVIAESYKTVTDMEDRLWHLTDEERKKTLNHRRNMFAATFGINRRRKK